MKYKVVILFLFLLFNRTSAQVKDISYNYQYLLTHSEANNDDDVGRFFTCFTYDTVDVISFSKVSGNEAFDIDPSTGMIHVNANTLLATGRDTIGIQICDGTYCDTYFAIITTIANENCVFIDPAAGSGGDGTYGNPFDSWVDIGRGKYQAGYAYLQKRGTTDIKTVSSAPIAIGNSQGTPGEHISIGAYGKGANPVVINGNPEGNSIVFGNLLAGGAKYVDVYNFEFKDCQGLMVESSSYNEHLMFTDITISNCSDNANFYFKEPYPDDFYNMDISLYNIVSYNPATSHCIKTNRDVDITNAHVYGAKKHGISFHDKCTLKYVNAHHNNTYGLEFQGDSSLAIKCVVYGNSDGVQFDEDSWDHNAVDSCYVFKNSDEGIEVVGTDNVTLTNNSIYNNHGDGVSVRTYSDSIIVSRNKIFNNLLNGIHIYSYVGYGLKTIMINRNIFYGNDVSVLAEEGRHIFVYNNTCYLEGIEETTSGYLEAKNNILSYMEGTWVASNNLITDNSAIFENAGGFDFHLVSAATEAINQGTDVGFTIDFEGNTIPYGSNPDIGAFEYRNIINSFEEIVQQHDNVQNIYPNPFKDIIQVENAGGIRKLEVMNLLGEVLFEATGITAEKHHLDLGVLKVGNYIIKITEKTGITTTRKAIKFK